VTRRSVLRGVSTVLIAAARFRAMLLTSPNEPPKYRLVPPTARVLTRYDTDGLMFAIRAPVVVSKAAIRLRTWPSTRVKSPPMKTLEPSGEATIDQTMPFTSWLKVSSAPVLWLKAAR